MDNLRSLSGSLPRAPSSRRNRHSNHQSQQQVMEAFKAAARCVTELYRNATADIATSYSDGYQDALADLLQFMDKETIGVGDGEGWRVRGWLAERIEGSGQPQGTNTSVDGDGEESAESEEEKRARSSSPVLQQASGNEQAPNRTIDAVRSVSPPRPGSAPPAQQQNPNPHAPFTFQSQHAYPSQDMDLDGQGQQQQQQPRMRVNFTGRPSRNSRTSRINQHNSSRGQIVDLGSAAGAKRKIPFADLFDIPGFEGSNVGNRRDGSGGTGGGKKTRTS